MNVQKGMPHSAIGGSHVSETVVSTEAGADAPKLPPEVWAMILEFLPFGSANSCAATSKLFALVLPLVTEIHIESSAQLNVKIAQKRFRDVRDIYIYSILKEPINVESSFSWDHDRLVDHNTAITASAFLSSFPSLNRVFFGRIDRDGTYKLGTFGKYFHYTGDNGMSIRHLLDSFSGAFECGSIQQVKVHGLCCARLAILGGDVVGECKICTRLCKCFPIEHVFDFQCCLPKAEIRNIVSGRQGGEEFLRSEARLLQLLGSGTCEKIAFLGRFWTFYLVHYSSEQLEEMGKLVQSFVCVSNLNLQEVSTAIKRSFTKERQECYLSEPAFYHLKKQLGLPIREDEFLTYSITKVDHLHHVVNGVMGTNVALQTISAHSISNLISRKDGPIQQVVESGVLAKAVRLLLHDEPWLQAMAASIWINVACHDSEIVAKSGAIPHLVQLTGSSHDSASEMAVKAIANTTGTPAHIHLLIQAGVVQPLLRLLTEPWSLTNAKAKNAARALKNLCCIEPSGVHTAVVNSIPQILARNDDEDVLMYACIALGHLAKQREATITALFDATLCRNLVAMISHETPRVHFEALHALGHVVSSNSSHVKSIISYNAMPSLLNLLIKGCAVTKTYVCWVVTSIASADTKNVQILIDADFANPLIQVLTNAGTEEAQQFATNAIVEMIKQGSQNQISALTPHACIQHLCTLLQLGNPENITGTTSNALNGLWNICRALQYNSHETWIGAIQTMVDAGTCQFLSGLLSNNCHQNQFLARDFLQYIISNVTSRTQHIIDGIIQHQEQAEQGGLSLLRLLISGSLSSLQSVCGVITSMVISDNNLMQALINNEYTVPLVKAVTKLRSYGTSGNYAAGAILAMMKHGTLEQVSFLVSQGCLGPFCDVLIEYDQEVSYLCATLNLFSEACARLALSSCNGQNVVMAMLSETDPFRCLVKLLSHGFNDLSWGASYILQWIVDRNASLAESIINSSSTEFTLLHPLINGCYDSQAAACCIINGMVSKSNRLIQDFINAGYIAPLNKVLKDAKSEKLIACATSAISAMIQHGTQEQISSMVVQGFLQPLCNVLVTDNSQVAMAAIDAIGHVINIASNLENKNVAGLHPLHCDDMDKVRELQGRFEGIFSDRCKEILRLFSLICMNTTLNKHTCFSLRKRRRLNSNYDD